MSANNISVGTRVNIPGKPEYGEGTVLFVGKMHFDESVWVGIELDKPGMNFLLYK